MGRLSEGSTTEGAVRAGPAFVFDLDGTLVDSVYQHVLAWREALEEAGIKLAVWRIHRRIGMSGGLFVNALARETGRRITGEEAARLQRRGTFWPSCPSSGCRGPSPRADGWRAPARRWRCWRWARTCP